MYVYKCICSVNMSAYERVDGLNYVTPFAANEKKERKKNKKPKRATSSVMKKDMKQIKKGKTYNFYEIKILPVGCITQELCKINITFLYRN